VIARYGDEIFTAANSAGVYVLLEAAAVRGYSSDSTLKQSLSVNRIHAVTGTVNGTTNYILTAMQTEGRNFADVSGIVQQLVTQKPTRALM